MACPPGGTDVTWSNHARPFLDTWCTGCHHSAVVGADRFSAPVGVDFDSYARVREWGPAILDRAVLDRTMPPVGGPSDEGRALLGEWLACGMPGGSGQIEPPCTGERALLPGDLVVGSAADLDSFCASYDGLSGDLRITGGGALALDCLCEVGGSVEVLGAAGLTALFLPNVRSVGGGIRVEGNPALVDLDLSAVEFAGAEVSVQANPALGALWLSRLFEVRGSLAVRENPGMVDLGLERLRQIEGDLLLEANPQWTTLFGDAYALRSVGGDLLLAGNPELTGFYGFIELEEVEGDLGIVDNDSFEDFFGFTALTRVGGSLEIRGNARLGQITGFDHLESVGGSLIVEDNPVMRFVHGYRVLDRAGPVRLVGLPQLQSVSGLATLRTIGALTVSETGLVALTELNGLSAIDGDLTVTDNPNLPSAQVDSLVSAVGAGNISGAVINTGNAP